MQMTKIRSHIVQLVIFQPSPHCLIVIFPSFSRFRKLISMYFIRIPRLPNPPRGFLKVKTLFFFPCLSPHMSLLNSQQQKGKCETRHLTKTVFPFSLNCLPPRGCTPTPLDTKKCLCIYYKNPAKLNTNSFTQTHFPIKHI